MPVHEDKQIPELRAFVGRDDATTGVTALVLDHGLRRIAQPKTRLSHTQRVVYILPTVMAQTVVERFHT